MVLKERHYFYYFDWLLVVAPVLLMTVGTIMIYNTTSTTPGLDTSDLLHDLTFRQIIYALVGLTALFTLSVLDYRTYAALRWPIYGVTIGLLAVVLAIGQITHGAQRWIDFNIFQLQPSELSKMLIVLVLAKFLADHIREISHWRQLFM
jgi:rod shape determining protein RodA